MTSNGQKWCRQIPYPFHAIKREEMMQSNSVSLPWHQTRRNDAIKCHIPSMTSNGTKWCKQIPYPFHAIKWEKIGPYEVASTNFVNIIIDQLGLRCTTREAIKRPSLLLKKKLNDWQMLLWLHGCAEGYFFSSVLKNIDSYSHNIWARSCENMSYAIS